MRTSFEDRKELRQLAEEAAKEPPFYKEGSVSNFIDKLGRFKLAEDLLLDLGNSIDLINHINDVLETLLEEPNDVTQPKTLSPSDEGAIKYCIEKIQKFKEKPVKTIGENK